MQIHQKGADLGIKIIIRGFGISFLVLMIALIYTAIYNSKSLPFEIIGIIFTSVSGYLLLTGDLMTLAKNWN